MPSGLGTEHCLYCILSTYIVNEDSNHINQGRIQDFLGEGASQAEMTDVQSYRSLYASAFANI